MVKEERNGEIPLDFGIFLNYSEFIHFVPAAAWQVSTAARCEFHHGTSWN